MPFGNVNVDFKPCKSAGQLKAAALYMLGRKTEQVRNETVKTAHDLYDALGCNRDNFANSILVTRKLNGKSYSKLKPNTILAHKISISFHPDDNDKLTYREAYEIAREFAKSLCMTKALRFCLRCIQIVNISTPISLSATAISTRESPTAEINVICMKCPSSSGSSA